MDYNQINIPKPKGLWRLLFVVALFLIAVPLLSPMIKEKISLFKQSGIEHLADDDGYFQVIKIIDGDSIELLGGVRVRYIGLDAPEMNSDFENYECYAQEATDRNIELLVDKKVKLITGTAGEDEFGRFLRYVYLPNGTFVNLELIKGGYASVMSITPNLEFENEFKQAEKEAIAEGKGMWGECIDQ